MAQWSEAEAAKKKAARRAEELAPVLAERAELFARFRKHGWQVNAVVPAPLIGVFDFVLLPDDAPSKGVHFRVKMPGAAPVLVRTIHHLYIKAKGLN